MNQIKPLVWTLVAWVAAIWFGVAVPADTWLHLLLFQVVHQLILGIGGFAAGAWQRLLQAPMMDAVVGAFAGVGLFLLGLVVGSFTRALFAAVFGTETAAAWFEQEQEMAIEVLTTIGQGGVHWPILLVVVLAPICEEAFFRGLVLPLALKRWSATGAVMVSAFVFATMHFYFAQFIPVFVSGLLLGALYVSSRSITRPIIAHGVHNALTLTLLYWAM